MRTRSLMICFEDDFIGHPDKDVPDGWQVEKQADTFHLCGYVQDAAYDISFPGNKHLPLMPAVRDFDLTFSWQGSQHPRNQGIVLYFRYNPHREEGYVLRHLWEPKKSLVELGFMHGGICRSRAVRVIKRTFPEPDQIHRFQLTVRGRTFKLTHNDVVVGEFSDTVCAGTGVVGFDRDGLWGRSRFGQIVVRTPERMRRTAIWPEIKAAFPADINGMTTPFYYHVHAEKIGDIVEIRTQLTGGPSQRPPSPIDFRRLWANEKLTNPYIRLEARGGRELGKFYLFHGSVGLKEHWNPRASGFTPADTETPVKRLFRVKDLPQDANLIIGYDYYAAEDRLPLQGGPSEALLDPKTGGVLFAGAAFALSCVNTEIRSAAEKKFLRLIPINERRRAQARRFAETNHYFMESEPCRFRVICRSRDPELVKSNLEICVRLENVFKKLVKQVPAKPLKTMPGRQNSLLNERLGIRTLESAEINFSRLPVGVYHVHVSVMQREKCISHLRRAFEVMSADPAGPAAPLASGLPELYPLLPDYATLSDGFDPWVGEGVDSYHYLAGSCYQPMAARDWRIWTMIHLYRRRWLLWLAARTTPTPQLNSNLDLIRQADIVYPFDRMDLWRISDYRGETLDVLRRFTKRPEFKPAPDGALTSAALEGQDSLTRAQYLELTRYHFKEWVSYFNRWHFEEFMPRIRGLMDQAGGQAEIMNYGLYPPYGSVYKGGYFPRFMGRDPRLPLERYLKGPLFHEDYPYMCGYPIQRGVYMLAALKLENPKLKIYPEVYCLNGCYDDSHVVFAHPPYGTTYAPFGYFRKRFLEYAYAACWFDGKNFRFWDDRGFQASCWDQQHFDEFLETWELITQARPVKPLRTTAFVTSREACLNHAEQFDPGKTDDTAQTLEMYNTAEETPMFAYEQARLSGQSAGFLVELAQIDRLDPRTADLLVLPPLTGVSPDRLETIRTKHRQGINLLAFEDVTGLEDLFGVVPLDKPTALDEIKVIDINKCFGSAAGDHSEHGIQKSIFVGLFSCLSGKSDFCRHPRCAIRYDLKGARMIMEGFSRKGEIRPALVLHKTRWGQTALFTFPVTMFHRAWAKYLCSYGKESMSALVNQATALMLKYLGSPAAETTAGKLLAFWDRRGHVNVIVEEDDYLTGAKAIAPIVTIHASSKSEADIRCDRPFVILNRERNMVRLRVWLEPHQSAWISINSPNKPAKN